MVKKVAVNSSDIANILFNYFADSADIEIIQTDFAQIDNNYDLICVEKEEGEISEVLASSPEVINVHYSLLPAFSGKDAIKNSYTSGVKVGGVTIHKVEPENFYGKIYAQYPVLIGNTTHFDEYKKELEAVRNKILPVVVDSILNDRVFDFSDLMKNSCHSGCGNCKGCSH
ncbi:hypothetical protein IKR55_01055 [bacterium]|nr:hypothetical protein [bacterium]